MKIRLPAELKQELTDAANRNGRSINAELVLRLGASFRSPDAREAATNLPTEVLVLLREIHGTVVKPVTAAKPSAQGMQFIRKLKGQVPKKD